MESNINQEICSKCKFCIEVCPCNIIGINTKEEVYFIPERKSICLHCGQCMAVCNTKAITVNGLSYDNDFIDLPENNIDYKNFIDFLANRRSIRNFKNKPISNEIINQILDDIIKWVENPITSFLIKRKKGQETFNTIKNHLYPIAKLENYKLKYGDRITRDAPAILIFHAEKGAEEHTNNSLIYATYSILAAHALGLGATIIGIVPAAINKVKKIREIFQIPEENEAIISVIIGYPKYKYKRTIKRKIQNINWIE